MIDLKSRTAWVAGGGRGIGRAIAEKLAGYGACVVAGSRTPAETAEVAAAIRRSGGAAARRMARNSTSANARACKRS